jgi:hypothetical protein
MIFVNARMAIQTDYAGGTGRQFPFFKEGQKFPDFCAPHFNPIYLQAYPKQHARSDTSTLRQRIDDLQSALFSNSCLVIIETSKYVAGILDVNLICDYRLS